MNDIPADSKPRINASCDVEQSVLSWLETQGAQLVKLREAEACVTSRDSGLACSAVNYLSEALFIIDEEGQLGWGNAAFQAIPEGVQQKALRICRQAMQLIDSETDSDAKMRTARPMGFQSGEEYFEVRCDVVKDHDFIRGVGVLRDATHRRRLEVRMETIERAGRDLGSIDSESFCSLAPPDRLKLIEEKIIRYSREILHFDHFCIRLLDRKSGKLEVAFGVGLPDEALDIDIYPEAEGNGISGYVAATGRSYVCRDTEKNARYIIGLAHSRSSLTVPLIHNDQIVGVYNIESQVPQAFDEDDRQVAEAFGRHVADALHILDLLVVERYTTSGQLMENVLREMQGPLASLKGDMETIRRMDPPNADWRLIMTRLGEHLRQLDDAMARVRCGPTSVIGSDNLVDEIDPVLSQKRVLLADDDQTIRESISRVLASKGARVQVVSDGYEACVALERQAFDFVVSDIRMPYRNGYEIYAASQRSKPGMPVLLMTGFGYDPNHSIVRASQDGQCHVIFKPFDVEAFIAAIYKALGVSDSDLSEDSEDGFEEDSSHDYDAD